MTRQRLISPLFLLPSSTHNPHTLPYFTNTQVNNGKQVQGRTDRLVRRRQGLLDRRHPGTLSLPFSAPISALLAISPLALSSSSKSDRTDSPSSYPLFPSLRVPVGLCQREQSVNPETAGTLLSPISQLRPFTPPTSPVPVQHKVSPVLMTWSYVHPQLTERLDTTSRVRSTPLPFSLWRGKGGRPADTDLPTSSLLLSSTLKTPRRRTSSRAFVILTSCLLYSRSQAC